MDHRRWGDGEPDGWEPDAWVVVGDEPAAGPGGRPGSARPPMPRREPGPAAADLYLPPASTPQAPPGGPAHRPPAPRQPPWEEPRQPPWEDMPAAYPAEPYPGSYAAEPYPPDRYAPDPYRPDPYRPDPYPAESYPPARDPYPPAAPAEPPPPVAAGDPRPPLLTVLLWTAGFFLAPLFAYLIWAVTRSGALPAGCVDAGAVGCASPRAGMVGTLAGALPELGLGLALSLLVAVGLRRIAVGWRGPTLGFSATVVGAGLTTLAFTALG